MLICPGGAVSSTALTSAPPWANIHTSVWHVLRNVVTPERELAVKCHARFCARSLFYSPNTIVCLFFFLRYALLIENNFAKLPVDNSVTGSVEQAQLHMSHPTLSSQAVQIVNDFYKATKLSLWTLRPAYCRAVKGPCCPLKVTHGNSCSKAMFVSHSCCKAIPWQVRSHTQVLPNTDSILLYSFSDSNFPKQCFVAKIICGDEASSLYHIDTVNVHPHFYKENLPEFVC